MFEALLARGYFPKELPPCFSTEQFAVAAANERDSLRAAFQDPPFARCCPFSLARRGFIRRPLQVPNPIPHFHLCHCIDTNWATINAFVSTSPISLSSPTPGPPGKRAVLPRLGHDALLLHRARRRSGYKFILNTDISEFYKSVYTHSIPWALHTKPVAKARKGDLTLLGNQLDRLVCKAQDQQTVGIPIGPDTSLVIAEIVATGSDNNLAKRCTDLTGYRHYDDYEFMSKTAADAQGILSTLQDALYEYELRLGGSKTGLYEAPVRLEEAWVSTLRRFRFAVKPQAQADDLIQYFDFVGDYAHQYPREHITRFALGTFRKWTVHAANWDLLQSLLCQALVADPSAIYQFVTALNHHQGQAYAVSRDLIEPLLNEVVEKYSPLHFHEELSWALWGLLAFGFSLHQKAAAAVCSVDNSMVALLVLDAVQQGRVEGAIDTSKWERLMTGDELFREQWLLSYEGNVKGWLPSQGGLDHVSADPFFGELKKRGVQFYSPVVGTAALAPSLAMREEWFY